MTRVRYELNLFQAFMQIVAEMSLLCWYKGSRCEIRKGILQPAKLCGFSFVSKDSRDRHHKGISQATAFICLCKP
jgi:hypothetical protein